MYVMRREGDGEVLRSNWSRSVWAGQAWADGSGTDKGAVENAVGCGYHTPQTWVASPLYSSNWPSHGPGNSSDISRGLHCLSTDEFSILSSRKGIRYGETE